MTNKLFYLTLALVAATEVTFAQQASAVAEDHATYAMIMSYGSLPNDKDVMVIRHEGRVYSFKYCPAFAPNPVPDIVQIRKNLFLSSKDPEPGSELQGQIKTLFQSPSCHLMGHQAYGIPDTSFAGDEREYVDKALEGDTSLGTGVLGLVTIPFLFTTKFHARYAWAQQNTLTAMKFFLSPRFPRWMASISTVLLGTTTGLGYWTYHVISKNKAAAQVAADEQSAKSLIAKSVGDNIVVVGPMADFYRDFQKSFRFALERHWLVEL
jgi:hypothetical protein